MQLLPYHLALFVSGAAALVYEVGWSRMLQRVFGVSDLAVATVLGVYFLGLGIGSYAGGALSKRAKRPAMTYAALEVGVAIFAVASLALVPVLHRVHASFGQDASFAWLTLGRLGLAMLVLLPPTVLMGATLPVLVRSLASSEHWAQRVGALYATNTIGAVVGAGLTGFFLLPTFGTRASVMMAAGASVLAAVIAAVAFRASQNAPEKLADSEPIAAGASSRVALAAALAGVGGFASLAGEVVWTRVLRICVQGTTQAFAGMLVIYLLGIAIGGALGGRLARDSQTSLRMLGRAQLLLGALSACALAFANLLPPLLSLVQGPGDLSLASPTTVLILAALLLGPLAVVLGTTVPLAWGVVSGADASGATGRVLAANTLGGLIGSFATGFALIPFLGVNATTFTLVLAHLLLAAIALRVAAQTQRAKILALAVPALLAAVILRVQPSIDLPYLVQSRNDPERAVLQNWRANWAQELVFLREGRNTTVSVAKDPLGLRLYNDGRPESGLSAFDPGFGADLIVLGGLARVYAERADRAMAVGLGGGHTTTMLLAGGFARVDVVELEEAVVDAARFIHTAMRKPFPLDDARAHLIVDDARARLARATPGTYDAVVSQPSHPWLAGSSALYTVEFFREVNTALRDDGAFVLWVNCFRNDVTHLRDILATLHAVFPNVHGYWLQEEGTSVVLVARKTSVPLAFGNYGRVSEGMLLPYFRANALDSAEALLSARELSNDDVVALSQGATVLTDDLPRLEMALGRLPEGSRITARAFDDTLALQAWFGDELRSLSREVDASKLLELRIGRVESRPVAIARVERWLRSEALSLSTRTASLRLTGDIALANGRLAEAVRLWDSSGAEKRACEWRLRARQTPVDFMEWAGCVMAIDASTSELPRERPTGTIGPTVCPVVLVLMGSPSSQPWRDVPEMMRIAADCATQEGNAPLARQFEQEHARASRALAIRYTSRAQRDAEGGNVNAAEMWARTALSFYPAQASAAALLIDVLARSNRRPEAQSVYEQSIAATRGMQQSQDAIRRAAAAAGLQVSASPQTQQAPSATTTPAMQNSQSD